MQDPLAALTLEHFKRLLGNSARIERDDVRVSMRLESAMPSPYPSARPAGGFSLVLAGPAQPALAQGIYCIDLDGLDPLELFLTPVAADSETRSYEIVFN